MLCAVITGHDLSVVGRLVGRRLRDMPILAEEQVRFIGEPVAAVAADSPALAESALESI